MGSARIMSYASPPATPMDAMDVTDPTPSERESQTLAAELQAHLDEHGHSMSDQAHLTLSNYALRLHNRLTGALATAGSRRNRSNSDASDESNFSLAADSFDEEVLDEDWCLSGMTADAQMRSRRQQPPTPQERRLVETVLANDRAVYTSKAARVYVERELERSFMDWDDDSAHGDDDHPEEVLEERQEYVRHVFANAYLTMEDVAIAAYDDAPLLVAPAHFWDDKGKNTFWVSEYLEDFKTTNPIPATKAEALAAHYIGVFYDYADHAVTGSGADSYVLITPMLVTLLKRVHRGALKRNAVEDSPPTTPTAPATRSAPAPPLRQTLMCDFAASKKGSVE